MINKGRLKYLILFPIVCGSAFAESSIRDRFLDRYKISAQEEPYFNQVAFEMAGSNYPDAAEAETDLASYTIEAMKLIDQAAKQGKDFDLAIYLETHPAIASDAMAMADLVELNIEIWQSEARVLDKKEALAHLGEVHANLQEELEQTNTTLEQANFEYETNEKDLNDATLEANELTNNLAFFDATDRIDLNSYRQALQAQLDSYDSLNETEKEEKSSKAIQDFLNEHGGLIRKHKELHDAAMAAQDKMDIHRVKKADFEEEIANLSVRQTELNRLVADSNEQLGFAKRDLNEETAHYTRSLNKFAQNDFGITRAEIDNAWGNQGNTVANFSRVFTGLPNYGAQKILGAAVDGFEVYDESPDLASFDSPSALINSLGITKQSGSAYADFVTSIDGMSFDQLTGLQKDILSNLLAMSARFSDDRASSGDAFDIAGLAVEGVRNENEAISATLAITPEQSSEIANAISEYADGYGNSDLSDRLKRAKLEGTMRTFGVTGGDVDAIEETIRYAKIVGKTIDFNQVAQSISPSQNNLSQALGDAEFATSVEGGSLNYFDDVDLIKEAITEKQHYSKAGIENRLIFQGAEVDEAIANAKSQVEDYLYDSIKPTNHDEASKLSTLSTRLKNRFNDALPQNYACDVSCYNFVSATLSQSFSDNPILREKSGLNLDQVYQQASAIIDQAVEKRAAYIAANQQGTLSANYNTLSGNGYASNNGMLIPSVLYYDNVSDMSDKVGNVFGRFNESAAVLGPLVDDALLIEDKKADIVELRLQQKKLRIKSNWQFQRLSRIQRILTRSLQTLTRLKPMRKNQA